MFLWRYCLDEIHFSANSREYRRWPSIDGLQRKRPRPPECVWGGFRQAPAAPLARPGSPAQPPVVHALTSTHTHTQGGQVLSPPSLWGGNPAWAPRMLQAGDALPGDRPGPRRAARTHAHSSPIILTAHPEADFIFITILWERILVQRGQNGAGNVSELMGSSNPAQAAYAPSPCQGQTDHPGGALRFLKSRQVHG